MSGKAAAWMVLIGILAAQFTLVQAAAPAKAGEKTFNSQIVLKVGETHRVGVFGGHNADCNKSVTAAVEVVLAPKLGDLKQTEGVQYVARNSLSHTCEGDQFLGTAVDYTATRAGVDHVRFDAVFANGRFHYIVTVSNH